jgi:Ca2+-binding RTX toxin-like protein
MATTTTVTLKGTSGSDSLTGTTTSSLILGLAGDDTLSAGKSNDTLDGGVGNDLLWGGGGSHTSSVLIGGDGDDTLRALYNSGEYAAQISMTGGAGRDVYEFTGYAANSDFTQKTGIQIVADLQDSILVDDLSMDALKLNGARKTITPDGTTVTFYAGKSTVSIVNAEQLGGLTVRTSLDGQTVTLAELSLLAEQSVVTRMGSAGADSLTGGQGDDIIYGGLGNDTLMGMGGNDSLFGGDTLGSGNDGDDLLDGGAGNDTLAASAGRDTLLGGEGNDQLYGGLGNVTLMGGAGDDTLTIGYGGTTMSGGADHAEFDGGAGADRFICMGDAGRTLIHADGQDTVSFDSYSRANMDIGRLGAEGADTVVIRLGLGVPAGVAGPTQLVFDHASTLGGLSFEWADGSTMAWADILAEARKPLVNQNLVGGGGNDTILGGGGQDTLMGLAGNDFLSGGAGNDSITGGLGADTLVGGLGDDTLVGDKGNDDYEFVRGDGRDTIIDKDSTLFNADVLKINGAATNQLWFKHTGNDLEIDLLGTQDKVFVQDWFKGSANQVEKITAADNGKSLTVSKVNSLVNAMAAFSFDTSATSTLPSNTPASITKLVASSWA